MDVNTAWKLFCETGKIQDYINYTDIKNSVSSKNPQQAASIGANFTERNTNAGKDRGSGY